MRPMRSLYRRSRHNVPTLNMASMPDLIFTVLFFFMIVTHMRSDELKVRLEVPQGTEVQKLSNKAAVVNIYIGRLTDQTGQPGNWGVQLNGDVVSPEQIASRIEELRSGMSAENAEKLTISLRADRRTPMKLINAVKRELQDSYALRINYGAMEMK